MGHQYLTKGHFITMYSIVQKTPGHFQIYLQLLFSQCLRGAMQMTLLAFLKEDSNKLFHARLLTSYGI